MTTPISPKKQEQKAECLPLARLSGGMLLAIPGEKGRSRGQFNSHGEETTRNNENKQDARGTDAKAYTTTTIQNPRQLDIMRTYTYHTKHKGMSGHQNAQKLKRDAHEMRPRRETTYRAKLSQ